MLNKSDFLDFSFFLLLMLLDSFELLGLRSPEFRFRLTSGEVVLPDSDNDCCDCCCEEFEEEEEEFMDRRRAALAS